MEYDVRKRSSEVTRTTISPHRPYQKTKKEKKVTSSEYSNDSTITRVHCDCIEQADTRAEKTNNQKVAKSDANMSGMLKLVALISLFHSCEETGGTDENDTRQTKIIKIIIFKPVRHRCKNRPVDTN